METEAESIAAWNHRTIASMGSDDARDRLMIELAYCRHVGLPVSETADRVIAALTKDTTDG